MHENVLFNKNRHFEAIKEDQKQKRIFYRGYPLEKFHYHEMSEEELAEYRKEYDELIDRLFPAQ